MSRVGRKRTQRGYLSREVKDISGRIATSEQPHRRTLPASLRLSEKAATALGRLNLMGSISDEQHEAGQRFQVTVGEYRASIGAPGNGARGGGYACAPRWDGERMVCLAAACECRRRLEVYLGAMRALQDTGLRSSGAVRLVAILDLEPDPLVSVAELRAGLTALVGFYGLDRRGREGRPCV
jgi:hypothetical protein